MGQPPPYRDAVAEREVMEPKSHLQQEVGQGLLYVAQHFGILLPLT